MVDGSDADVNLPLGEAHNAGTGLDIPRPARSTVQLNVRPLRKKKRHRGPTRRSARIAAKATTFTITLASPEEA